MATLTDDDRHVIIDRRPGHYLAFPDICRTQTGRLVVVYREADQHVATRRKLLIKCSDDAGNTWSAPFILNAAGGHCPRIACLSDNQLVIIDDDPHLLYWSADDGHTWMRQMVNGFRHGIPDRIIELDANTLLTTAQWNKGTQPFPACGQPPIEQMVYRSGNRGLDFTPLAAVSHLPWLTLCEGSTTRLPDGRLLMLLRENSQVFEPMYWCESADNGATWSEPRPSGLIGHRPCLGLTRSGRLLVTYRNVGPERGTAAWLGEPADAAAWRGPGERLERNGFQIHGVAADARTPFLREDALIFDQSSGPEQAARFSLRPLSDPAEAWACLEADIEITEAEASHCGLRLGCWWRITAARIAPELKGVRPVPLEPGRSHRIRIEYEAGLLSLAVDGRVRRRCRIEADAVERRPVLFGNASMEKNNAGMSRWQRLSLRIREPRLLRSYAWDWTPAQGLPDAWARRHVLELKNDQQAWPCDFGYSGWVELDDDAFLCVYHHGDGHHAAYRHGRSAHIQATRFFAHDFA